MAGRPRQPSGRRPSRRPTRRPADQPHPGPARAAAQGRAADDEGPARSRGRASARRGPSRRRTSCARACAWSACRTRRSSSCSGATGDLAHRKVIPALYQLWRTNLLPHEFVILADRPARRTTTTRSGPRSGPRSSSSAGSCRSTRRPGASFAERIRYHRLDFDDPDGFDALAPRLDDHRRGARDARQPALLPRDPAVAVRRDRRPARAGRARPRAPRRRLAADRHREAVRPRPRFGEAAQPRGRQGLPRVAGLPHRPLPGQGDRPEPAGLPVRERHLRAALESALRRPRPDHRGRVDRHREPRRVLRGDRRVARRPPEPPAPAGQPDRDGAAGDLRGRRAARREGQGPARDRDATRRGRGDVVRGQYGPGWVAATQVPGYRAGAGRRPRVGDRDVRRRQAHDRRLALVRRARSTSGPASACRSARPRSPSSTARSPTGCSRTRRVDPDPNLLVIRIQPDEGIMLRFGAKVPGLGHGRPLGDDGLHLRLGVQRRLARRLRDAHPRRAPGRRLAVHPGRRGRGGLEHRRSDHRRVGRRARRRTSRTTTPGRGGRPRPTSCSPATAGAGAGSRGRDGRRHPAQDRRAGPALVGAGRTASPRSRASSPGSGPART